MYMQFTCPPNHGSTAALIKDEEGKPLEISAVHAQIEINWDTGAPPRAIVECLCPGLDIHAEADVRVTTLSDGKKYRLMDMERNGYAENDPLVGPYIELIKDVLKERDREIVHYAGEHDKDYCNEISVSFRERLAKLIKRDSRDLLSEKTGLAQ